MPRAFPQNRPGRATLHPFPYTPLLPAGSIDILFTHRMPPRLERFQPGLDQLMEGFLPFVEQHCANDPACFILGIGKAEKVGLQMSAGDGISLAPAHEKKVRPDGSGLVVGHVGDDLDAVGRAVAPFERRGSIVHGHVPADRVWIALRMIIGEESAHACYRRLPTISLKTLPVRNATLAGRSASRRMRYGYHCVPNGTYTRIR